MTVGPAPRVSVGLPVFNGERYLRNSLDSILSQTFSDFELIISDNASTDRTMEICLEYQAQDSRIRYVRNIENLGAARNYNQTFNLSHGEYFKWASHDDIIAPAFLEKCLNILDTHPAYVLCYPRTIIIDQKGTLLEIPPCDDVSANGNTPQERLRHFLISRTQNGKCNAVFGVIRSSILKRTALIGSFASSDVNLLAELALCGQFYHLDDPLFYRRYHPESSMMANPGLEERTMWFDSRKNGAPKYQHWAWLLEYLAAIRRVPMSYAEKIFCSAEMLRWMAWERANLIGELWAAPMNLFIGH